MGVPGGVARPPPSKPAWYGVILDLPVAGVRGEGDGTRDSGEVLVTTIVLLSGHFEEVSTPAVLFREDSLEAWLFICGFDEFESKDFDVVQFSCSVMSDSLRPHEPQHARPPCPSPIPRVYPNSCPLSR